jgi:ribosomal protein S12 methylthiotransferase
MKKIHITTLGCSKNTVDSEWLAGYLETNHYEIVNEPQDAQVIILNTCGFINDAKEESIQAIFEALELKKEDPAKKVFVSGCLSARYRGELEEEIPDVDAIFGTEEYEKILDALGRGHSAADNLHRTRKLSTPTHIAYLKISEGCDHHCSFCAIPQIRGAHRSRKKEQLLEEARLLAEQGVQELILISQDTTSYGKDIYGRQEIVSLVRELSEIEGIRWIRVLYWYPADFPLEFLDLINENEKVLPYIDLPLQHISDSVLRLMRRGDRRDSIVRLLETIRRRVPEIVIRTTFIVGHPGETEEDFEALYNFVKEMEFDRLGTFLYSDEEGTHSFELSDKVDPEIAAERQNRLMTLQREISFKKNYALIGKREEALVDDYDEDNDFYIARSYRDAPEIDNEIIISGGKSDLLPSGSYVHVEIIDAGEYELYGKLIADL